MRKHGTVSQPINQSMLACINIEKRKKMKRLIIIFTAAIMVFSLCACGNEKNETPEPTGRIEPVVETTDDGVLPSDGSAVQASADILHAIEESDKLTTGSYLLMEDGSIVTRGESYNGFAGDYAALQNISKLVDSSSEMELLALTEEGDLYYRQAKIVSNVTDVVYSTTNINQTAIFISEGKIYRVRIQKTSDVNAELRQQSPDTYIDVDGETVNYYELNRRFSDLNEDEPIFANGELIRLSAEKSDFFVLNSAGKVFMDNNDGFSEEYIGLDCFDWSNIVLIDAAKVMLSDAGDSNTEAELTVAGIQSDGTVRAVGAYADEILSWGNLNYISMDDALIVGLTPDGHLKAAGQAAEFVESDLNRWANIVGVKVGNVSGTTIVNAVDKDGTYYHLEYDVRWTENNLATVSIERGCSDSSGAAWYRYCQDGTVLRSVGANEGWE